MHTLLSRLASSRARKFTTRHIVGIRARIGLLLLGSIAGQQRRDHIRAATPIPGRYIGDTRARHDHRAL